MPSINEMNEEHNENIDEERFRSFLATRDCKLITNYQIYVENKTLIILIDDGLMSIGNLRFSYKFTLKLASWKDDFISIIREYNSDKEITCDTGENFILHTDNGLWYIFYGSGEKLDNYTNLTNYNKDYIYLERLGGHKIFFIEVTDEVKNKLIEFDSTYDN